MTKHLVVSEEDIKNVFEIGLQKLDREFKFAETSKHKLIEDVEVMKYELLKRLRTVSDTLRSIENSGAIASDPLVEKPTELKTEGLKPLEVVPVKKSVERKRLYLDAK